MSTMHSGWKNTNEDEKMSTAQQITHKIDSNYF